MVTVTGTAPVYKIEMPRGDTAKLSITPKVKQGDTLVDYVPQEGDSIRFAVKKKYTDGTPVILKDIPTDTLILQIDPEDTKPLGMGRNGEYVYDIQITLADGTVDTFISGKLCLLEEVD